MEKIAVLKKIEALGYFPGSKKGRSRWLDLDALSSP